MSRIRANQITNQSADGAPTVQNGLVISGVTTSTTFSGSGASLTNIPSAQLTGALPAISGANLTGIDTDLVSDTSPQLGGDLASNSHDVLFADNDKAIFGTGSDFKIYHNGTDNYIMASNGHIRFDTGSAELARITSTGKLLVGTQTEGAAGADELTIATTGSTGLTIRSGTSNDGNIFFSDATSGTGEYAGYIQFEHANNALRFGTVNVERLRITSAGDLLIGNTNGGAEAINMVGGGGGILISRSESGSPSDGQTLGDIGLNSYSSSQTCSSADVLIRGQADGAHSGSSAGSALLLFTKPASTGPGSAPTERMRINKDGQVTQPAQPSFAAYRNQDGYSLNNAVFPFNATRHNNGNHFNTGNYRFTAPVAGRYMFTFHSILNTQINSGHYSFRVNNSTGQGHNVHFTTTNGHWDHVSSSQIMSLNANDYVTMWSNSNINWHGNGWQIFCGELLS